ncbi:MAG: LysR family transcriptional regulator [Erysipelotrichaceae bacterium]
MNGTQIRAFLLVCEKGSFSAAANEMFISKASISKLIKEIEKEFSTVCFIRSRFGCTLTEDGEILFKYIYQMNEIYNKAKSQISKKNNFPMIRLGYDPNKGESPIYKIRSILIKSKFNVELVSTNYYNFFDFIARLSIDFAFVAKPNTTIPKSICYSELLKTNIYALHLKSNHYFNSEIITISDLDNITIYMSPVVNSEDYSSLAKKVSCFHLKSIGIDDFISNKIDGVYITAGLGFQINDDYRLTKIADFSFSWGIAYHIVNQKKISNVIPIISSAIKKEEL